MGKPLTHSSTATEFLFTMIGRLLVWLVKQLARLLYRLLVVMVAHPRTTAALAIMSTLVLYVGWMWVVSAAGVVLVVTSTWKVAHPASFEPTVQTWVRTWWRRWWAYRRQWVATMTRCQLVVEYNGENHAPKLVKVRTTSYWDHLVLVAQVGQQLDDFRDGAERLRGAFGAQRVQVREDGPLRIGMSFMRHDPLLETVPATPIPESSAVIDFRAIPVGVTEMEETFTISVLGGSTATAGSTGAGKSGTFWNAVRYLAPAIADGLVRPVGIDPKGKELRQARAIFADGDYVTEPEDTLELLERLAREMKDANDADGAAGERDFVPRPGRPLTLINIDELAPLLKYWPRRLRDKIDDALGLLLTQGRGAGFIVLGAIQEPTKDVFQVRDLFTRRIAMRLPTESHTDAALIEDAVKLGAACHQIPESLPGVVFSLESGARSVVRARLGHVTDDDIAELVEYVTARRNVVALDSRRPAEIGKEIAA